MASFTFGSGNARKLLRLPLYALGALTTFLVVRSPRRWAFGSGIGLGEGSLALYREARARLGTEYRLTWLASTDDELAQASALGLEAVAKHSARGFWITLRSRVLVVTHGFGDVNRYGTRGGFVVQLWHGIPLKKLHLDSPAALRVSFLPDHRLVRAVVSRAYRFAGRGIGLFPVASQLVAPRIVSAFGVPADRVVATGDPRNDILLTGDPATRRASARAALSAALDGFPDASRIVLYAPTWRDGAADPGIPTPEEWDAIAAWLERTDSTLLVRAHPLGLGDYATGTALSPRIRLLRADRLPDVNPVLPAIDALITDYSSIAYDFSLVGSEGGGGPIVFLAPDIEVYARRRGLYENYRDFSGDRHVTSWDHVLGLLDVAAAGGEPARELADHVAWLRNEHFDKLDDGATARVLDEVARRTGIALPDSRTPGSSLSRPLVTDVQLTDGGDPRLVVRLDARGRAVTAIRLEGARARVDGDVEAHGDDVTVTFPLLVTRWGTPGLALPAGSYRLTLHGSPTTTRVEVAPESLPVIRSELFHATATAAAGGLVVRVEPPLADDERGARAQRALERAYRRSRPEPANAVFFESFYGQSVSCNPHAIDRTLAGIRPELERYWSVVDGSVAIPEGAIRIIEGSREWWRVRGSARVLVVNDWLRKRFRRRPHQHVLQTWHGTMLKRLALDRANRGLRTRIAVLRERARWDAMLSQNAHSTRIFRSAYAFEGPIWEDGYPRNDVFAMPERIAEVKRRIGVPDGARVVLYAPTWRDDRTEMVDYVDLTSFVSELGDDHVLLVRGHSRTLRYGHDLEAAGLIDVTSYPNMADMLLIADVLVTDYSSVMFDFAATGRPMVFFTPDLAHYSEDLRGFYFDLLAEAPGPVVRTREGLRDAILEAEAHRPGFEARAAAWMERFTPHDDGRAGERVVRRMLDAGWL
jgi:CDP-glycerol glycerophosphotransferase (TagB/SpsB family)